MGKEFNKRYFITPELAGDLCNLANCMYAQNHPEAEINNPKPLFEALGLKKPLSMQEKLDRLFKGPQGLIDQMYDQGEETPEEMADLDIPDNIEPLSPHEYIEMQPENPPPLQTEVVGSPGESPKPPVTVENPTPEANIQQTPENPTPTG